MSSNFEHEKSFIPVRSKFMWQLGSEVPILHLCVTRSPLFFGEKSESQLCNQKYSLHAKWTFQRSGYPICSQPSCRHPFPAPPSFEFIHLTRCDRHLIHLSTPRAGTCSYRRCRYPEHPAHCMLIDSSIHTLTTGMRVRYS